MSEKTPIKNEHLAESSHLSVILSPSPQIKQHGAGNLTGDLRKVKDMAADMHNLVSKWESLKEKGINILTEMSNLLIEKVFITQEDDFSEAKCLPTKLQPFCDSLEEVVEFMEHIVDKMTQKVTLADGLVSLQRFKRTNPNSQVLFLTMTLENVASTVKAIEEDYKKEIKLKREIYQNMAHSRDRDTAMLYLASWMHEPYISVQALDLIQALIKDTGHIK